MIVLDGVYAVRAEWRGQTRDGVANVGRKPTFGQRCDRTLEAHLFDFDADLYGRRVRVAFVERLRGEARFASPEALVRQIREDAARAREVLKA
jgi:riboflavin kinase/FMN adenylyltransferase